jgi:predicted AAA+ superfamily ATPase
MTWKSALHRKPLILSGARQVGKTWLLKMFGKEAFTNVAYINFDGNPRMQQLFSLDYNIPRLLSGLQAETATVIKPGETLIVFDEIQTNPAALTALKYFCEEAPDYAIVAAGSLLGVSMQQGSGFPVGKVDTLDLYPMSFTEFLEALGEGQLGGIGISSPRSRVSISIGFAITILWAGCRKRLPFSANSGHTWMSGRCNSASSGTTNGIFPNTRQGKSSLV